MASNAASQPVTFFTRTTYQLPSQKFMIPTSWKRYQLSQLINKALDLSKPVPFDFLIRGSILRNTLSSWCTENGVGEVCHYTLFSFFLNRNWFVLLPGRHSSNWVHRIGDATSKDLWLTPRRLGVVCLVAAERVRQFVHLLLRLS